MVINSEKNQSPRINKLETRDDNKENEFKFGKVETNVKNHEILVTELNKLCEEEKNIRNKLFTHSLKVCFKLFYYYINLNLCTYYPHKILGRF